MFSIHRNHLSDQGVDYVTFGRGDKVLVIITGLSLQGLSDMSDLPFTHYFIDLLRTIRSIFLIGETLSKKAFLLRIWQMTSIGPWKNCILLTPLS